MGPAPAPAVHRAQARRAARGAPAHGRADAIAVVAAGFVIGGKEHGRRENVEQTVRVEVREPPAPPPPPPPEEKRPEPPKPEPIVKKAATPPPKAKVPAPEPKGPPPRVVGISLDSTVEGGGGPAFATGETHNGQTAERAAAPKPPTEAPAPSPTPAPVAQSRNQVASRIPVAGVTYTQPKRRRPHEPAYPETLKAQELEADVKVMVSIDADGKVTKVKIISPSPYPEFNQAAEKAAHEEEFEPATRDGNPIPFTLSYTYRFRLETK